MRPFPFDNAFASLRLPAGEFRRLLGAQLGPRRYRWSRCLACACSHAARKAAWKRRSPRPDGSAVRDEDMLAITTTDFLATGGDGFFAGAQSTTKSDRPFATPWPRLCASAVAPSTPVIVRYSIPRARASACPPKSRSIAARSRRWPHLPSGVPGNAGLILARSTPMARRMVGAMSRCWPARDTDGSLVPSKIWGAFPWFLVPTSNP